MEELFIRGGILMYPIAICSILGLAIILERIYVFSKLCKVPKIDFLEIGKNFSLNDEVLKSKNQGIYADFIQEILKYRGNREKMEEVAQIEGEKVKSVLKRNIPFISFLASTVPLMGLLGTVLGMIKAFSKLSASNAGGDLSVLAGGIWEALLTTAAGLIVAIPLLFAAYFLNRYAKIFLKRLEITAAKVILENSNFTGENND